LEKTLTIILDGNTFKYEVEATVKIFYPATQFNIVYDVSLDNIVGDYVYTRMETTQEGKTLLTVKVQLGENSQQDTLTFDYLQESFKNEFEFNLCKLVYRLMHSLTGKSSAWGLLTGIRPVKKYIKLIEQGLSKEDIVSQMEDTYLISRKKSELAYSTAIVQMPILKTIEPKKVSIYVSIPFCNTRCAYCSFVSHSIESAKKLIPDYIYYLCREIESLGELIERYNLVVDTVYFGGGTPTSLEDFQLKTIMEKIQNSIDLSQVREYCVEAGRPDTITKSKLEVIKQFGADRISVNPQTFSDSVLETIGRKHSAQQTIDAFKLARSVGFDNINMDLIAGLPTDTLESFKHTIDTTVSLNPDAVTVHTLTLKRSATLFENQHGRDNVNNPVSAMVDYSVDTLTSCGYVPYYMYRQKNTAENLENVGYSKRGKESLYNIYIMDEIQTILGLGAGASTKLVGGESDISRVHNYKFPYEYINRFDDLMKKKSAIDDFFKSH
jgi:oxygen-independent coproporphyrinogen-3 oxidase